MKSVSTINQGAKMATRNRPTTHYVTYGPYGSHSASLNLDLLPHRPSESTHPTKDTEIHVSLTAAIIRLKRLAREQAEDGDGAGAGVPKVITLTCDPKVDPLDLGTTIQRLWAFGFDPQFPHDE